LKIKKKNAKAKKKKEIKIEKQLFLKKKNNKANSRCPLM
jgi:hypothetical protein